MTPRPKIKGLTLLEVLISMAIISALTSLAIPLYMSYLDKARTAACLSERDGVNKAIARYAIDHPGVSLASLSELADQGYLAAPPRCPYGGEYVLVMAEDEEGLAKVACSIHYWPATAGSSPTREPTPEKPLTSLGSTFQEISVAMINLIRRFYENNGRFPRSWGDYAFTDIGLDPLEWSVGYNGIIYTPSGNRLGIKPAEGVYFVVVDAKGKERELSDKHKWSLWYDMKEAKWFYHVVNKANEIEINTLRIYPQ